MPIYLPEGKVILHASLENPFMQSAKEAQEALSGDQLYPIGLVYVRDGVVLARGGNGFAKGGAYVHICPRVVAESKSGEGYDLCHHHDPDGHAEAMAIVDAKSREVDLTGADAYMYGHFWACQPCWDKMLAVGIKDLYVLEGAEEIFSREAVHARTIGSPSVKTAYLSCGLTRAPEATRSLYDTLKKACAEVGVELYCPHEYSDPSHKTESLNPQEVYELNKKRVQENEVVVAYVGEPSLGVGIELEIAREVGKPIILLSETGSKVSRMARGVPGVIYHVEFENGEDAKRKLQLVLRQL